MTLDILNDIATGLQAKAEEARAKFEEEPDLRVKMGYYGAASALIDVASVFREAASKVRTDGGERG